MVTRVTRRSVALAFLFVVAACGDRPPATESEIDPDTAADERLRLPALADEQYAWIAERIFVNETGGDPRKLVHWNEGEDFPSLGIGHFIWFPAGVDAPFDESFPAMAAWVREATDARIPFPDWLAALQPFAAPWPSRAAFYADFDSPEIESLRAWLDATRFAQAQHIVANFEARWNALALAEGDKTALTELLRRLQTTPEGLFATVDYVNFKGLGSNPRERYEGHGWGLVQVLRDTRAASAPDDDPGALLDAFSHAAAARLVRRAELAPPERNEARWVPGWTRRVGEYRQPPDRAAASP